MATHTLSVPAITYGIEGGGLYVDFLFEACGHDLTLVMIEVSDSVLKTHHLTKVWGSAITACNAATKAVGMEPVEFDLPSYAASQTLASLGLLITRREMAIRGGSVEGTTNSIVQVFGGGRVEREELIKSVVLVKKGSPRAIAISPMVAATLKGTDSAALGRDEASLAKAPCVAISKCTLISHAESGTTSSVPLSLVSKFDAVQKQGLWQHIEVGMGVLSSAEVTSVEAVCNDRTRYAGTTIGREKTTKPFKTSTNSEQAESAEDASSLLGAPIALVRRKKFLYLCIAGDAYPLAVYKWRYFEGNKIVACRHLELNSVTWREHGGCDWEIDDISGTISPTKAPQFVLGLRLVEKEKDQKSNSISPQEKLVFEKAPGT